MLTLLWIAAVLVTLLVLAYVNASGLAFTAAFGVALIAAWVAHTVPSGSRSCSRSCSSCSRFPPTCRCCGASSSATPCSSSSAV
jgi:hypothetical protein